MNNKSADRRIRLTWVMGAGLAMAACGGGGDGAAADPSTQTVSGVLVAPETSTATTAAAAKLDGTLRSKSVDATAAAAPTCKGVPNGYAPVANAAVAFADANGAAVGPAATTDACGHFDVAAVPAQAVAVNFAPPAGMRAVSTPIASLGDRDGDGAIDAVSTVTNGSAIEIVGLTLAGGKIEYIVRDTTTGKAVLGIPASAVAANGPGGAVTLSQYSYTALARPATLSLVLDASGSMAAAAATGSRLTRFEVTAQATKLFAERIGAQDKVATVVFDQRTSFLDAGFFTTGWPGRVVDASGQPMAFGLPADGFTSDRAMLQRVADFYNPLSDSWKLASAPVRFTMLSYPWGGSTALRDAISAGLDRVATTKSGRPFVMVMTDGADNASQTSVAALTSKAVAAKVPVFSIGIGAVTTVDSANLQALATASGGSFTLVADGDVQSRLPSVFDAVRTGIQFQYGATLGSTPAAGSSLRLAIDYAGLHTEASVNAN